MRSFKSNENIHKKEGGSYYVVSANKASSVTLQSPSSICRSEFPAYPILFHLTLNIVFSKIYYGALIRILLLYIYKAQ